jgi:hypothetical protein
MENRVRVARSAKETTKKAESISVVVDVSQSAAKPAATLVAFLFDFSIALSMLLVPLSDMVAPLSYLLFVR